MGLRKGSSQRLVWAALCLFGGAVGIATSIAACTLSNTVQDDPPRWDGGTVDGNPNPRTDGSTSPDSSSNPGDGSSDCVTNPKTHEEIINACTDAVRIDKRPNLPLILADGGLPPLP